MKLKISPYVMILLSFLFTIIIGSILLVLPFSLNEGVNLSYLDSLFISTSGVTITGLTPVIIKDTFSLAGRIILIVLMQVGGLSVTTIAFFIISILGARIGYKSRLLVQQSVSMDSMQGVIKVVKRIVSLTLIIEVIGIIIFFFLFLANGVQVGDAIEFSIFHTVASYNNAGFDIFSSNSLTFLSNDVIFNILTMLLIVLGGLGSIVIHDIIKKRSYKKLTFHSKIVLKMTLILILVGAISFFLLEKEATIIQSLFHSVTLRTAGFYSYDYNTVRQTTVLIMMILMFIGAAPASNGGGIKVTSLYTIYKSSFGYLGNKEAVAYKRSIPERYQRKSVVILFMSFNVLIIATLIISFFEKGTSVTTVFFEVISSLSNTGLTLSLTPKLSSPSKIIIITVMLIGRVGVLTFVNSVFIKSEQRSAITEFVDLEYIV
ncbi:MAG TPA: potassium transporter TrkG [Haploplasma sp.]|nr:potassium transporter TrkG [Haploplasma sp.]